MNGKGDKPRPVNRARWDKEFERIFHASGTQGKGRKKPKALRDTTTRGEITSRACVKHPRCQSRLPRFIIWKGTL